MTTNPIISPYTTQQMTILEQWRSLIAKVFHSSAITIELFNEQTIIPEQLNESYAQAYIGLNGQPILGIISLEDILAVRLAEPGMALLQEMADNMAAQISDNLALTALRTQLTDAEKSLSHAENELAVAYEDLELAHEELSEMHNLTLLVNRNFSRARMRIKSFLDQAPIAVAILRHRHLKVEIANPYILKLWGKTKEVIGKPLALALPELQDQEYLSILDQVYVSGERYVGKTAAVILEKKGIPVTEYFDFIYEPLTNENGKTNAIMIIATDATELVGYRKQFMKEETA